MILLHQGKRNNTIPTLLTMRRRFVLYKINQVPAGGDSISYLREVKSGKPYFTAVKREARRLPFSKAIFYCFRLSLSILPEKLA